MNEAEAEILVRALARKSAKARVDVTEFFEFVARSEEGGREIIAAPHQRLIFEFVEAHSHCVIRAFAGCSKTFGMQGWILHRLGTDATERGAVISAAQGQGQKVVTSVSRYIEQSPELRLVFPYLRRSSRDADVWTQTEITVEREGTGARDPSLIAIGFNGQLPGSRLTFVLIDDLLNAENTATAEGRRKVNAWVNSTVLTRQGVRDMKVVVTNVPWNPGDPQKDSADTGDLTFALARNGWAVMNIDAFGNVWFENTDFDSDLIRPSKVDPNMCRLVAHDDPKYARAAGIEVPDDATEWTDDADEIVTWPEVYPRDRLDRLRTKMSEVEFDQNYRIRVRNDATSKVKIAWVEKCKLAAEKHDPPVSMLVHQYAGPYPTFTGVDPAFGLKKTSDLSSIFTIAILPTGLRQVLNIEAGRWSTGDLVSRIVRHAERYRSIVYVESNAAQRAIKDWALERRADLAVRAIWTGREKWDRNVGLESLFVEIENGAWLIPNVGGLVDPETSAWISEMLFFDRKKHTGDRLMSAWIAREGARKSGYLKQDAFDDANESDGTLAALMTR